MATALPNAVAAAQGGGYVNPYAAQIEALQAQLSQPQAPMFTPEQIEQRRSDNQRQYMLGVLGGLSGDAGAADIGGQVLKQAVAARTPRMSEKGTLDPITGEFKYSADFLRERDEGRLSQLQQRAAAADAAYQEARTRAQERADLRRDAAADRAALRASAPSNEPLVKVLDENGEAVYLPRSQAAGKKPAPTGGGGQPSGDERNAAGFASRMNSATAILEGKGATGGEGIGTALAGTIPFVGKFARRVVQSSDQQVYDQAVQDWVRAKLRKESGASISPEEFAGEYETYFPQPGDGPERIAQKSEARRIANEAMMLSAGRAQLVTPRYVPPTDPSAPAAPAPAAAPGGGKPAPVRVQF